MERTMRQVRDIFNGLQVLSQQPIANHVLNFKLKNIVGGLIPLVENLGKEEENLLKNYCPIDPTGVVQRNEKGLPIWSDPKNELIASKAMDEILDELVPLPDIVKPLTWSLLEKTKCVYTDKEGKRITEPLIVQAGVQLLLGDFIEGEPSEVE